jgi:hypothetical protein
MASIKPNALLVLLPVVILAVAIIHQGTRDPESTPTVATAKAAAHLETNPAPAPRLEWSRIAAQRDAATPSGRIDKDSDYGRLLTAVEGMNGPQLVAAWDEFAAAELSTEARARFEPQVAGTLVRKDVELALSRFADQLKNPASPVGSLLLSPGFREWSAKSPLKAVLWLDARIEDGTLGEATLWNGTPVRVLYERELIRSLLSQGPENAAARLEAMPPAWRIAALQGTDTATGQRAFAALVRKYFPAQNRMAEFNRMAAAARYHEGEDGVARLLERIGATPEEREQIERVAARQE